MDYETCKACEHCYIVTNLYPYRQISGKGLPSEATYWNCELKPAPALNPWSRVPRECVHPEGH